MSSVNFEEKFEKISNDVAQKNSEIREGVNNTLDLILAKHPGAPDLTWKTPGGKDRRLTSSPKNSEHHYYSGWNYEGSRGSLDQIDPYQCDGWDHRTYEELASQLDLIWKAAIEELEYVCPKTPALEKVRKLAAALKS